ncbi:EAL domain-containing protein [Colwellia sp. D2M02]|uniref:bifunctional diguanylate cyclase/phosphodiesterase n=1 Tax=Colwellia sp. D2M02 TaxID=2841562 RepID=UPI001C09AD94|nr:EAL domain-containing protein [Colwellia sp. D2M02]MBU2895073.1 EAL domain-containing protein [Colwellia sp. D2M02]
MSLSRQLYLGLTLVLALVFLGSLWINVDNTRHYIDSQLSSHAKDTATSLGLSIKPFIGNPDDLPMVDGMMSAIFDSGYYQSMLLKNSKGEVILSKNNPMTFESVPSWFVSLFPLSPPTSSTEVHDGWVKPSTLEITSHPGIGYEQLWQSAVKSTGMILVLFLIAGTLVSLVLKTITTPIKKAAKQADEICQGNFIQVNEIPKPIELNLFVNAMNRMSRILQTLFNELTKQTENYQKVAYIDELTLLANRRSFNNQFEALLINKEQSTTGFLMIIRLSNLDSINKENGYTAGDEYVKTAVSLINGTLNYSKLLSKSNAYRLAGADFAVTLPDIDKENCHHLAVELMLKFNQAASQVEDNTYMNHFAHIGITDFSTENSMAEVLMKADTALMMASSTKQGWEFAPNSVMQHGNTLWKAELEQLLANKEFSFFAQNIKNSASEVIHQELYVRFNHTETGDLIPTGSLMAVAQRVNLAHEFDKLVINTVIQKAAALTVPVAININSASLAHLSFCQWLIDTLTENQPHCELFIFEINEQSLIQHANNVCYLSKQLKLLGCKVTLEHFGASTSSFTQLMKVKPDYVKIDGSYSQQIDSSPENQLFVQSLVNIAHSLQIEVIAELIENEAQESQLQKLFVDYFQGYFIDKPLQW